METFQVGEWRVKPELNRIQRGEEEHHLEPRVMDLLVHLAAHAGELLSKERLNQAVWREAFVSDGALTYSITQLRQLLGDDARQPRYVETIPRRGYRLIAEVSFEQPAVGEPPVLFKGRLKPESSSEILQVLEERSPYPGLAAFTEQDAALFFGREAEVEALWERIHARRLLAVIGSSGAGKTSFLRAGVIPARPEGWRAAYATPGANPLLGLARALTPELAGDAAAVSELLGAVAEPAQGGEQGVVTAARRWRSGQLEALLVVDQFEELFTLNSPETQARVATLLSRLSEEADVHVILSLRDDFLIHCSEHRPLAPVFESLTAVAVLKHDDLRRALAEPAMRRGYRFEDEALVEEILAAVEGERGALPLLAFAVSLLWEKRHREPRILTREAYREIASVGGALAQHAEATMDRIGLEGQGLVREVFRNLVTAQGTRAAMGREELLSVFPDRAAAEAVLRMLVDARLLTTYEVEGKAGEPHTHRVELMHESLLTNWPRLVRWQAQDTEGVVLRDQLRQAAHLWEEKGRSSDLLWTGTAYREFTLWRERYPGSLTAVEHDFARAMGDWAGRRRRRRRFALLGTFVSLLLVLVVIGVLLRQTGRALDRARVETARAGASKLVALGRLELDRYPTAAVAYARRSLEMADSVEGRLLALEALWRGAAARVLPTPEVSGTRAAFSPDGHRLAVGGFGSSVVLFSDDGRSHRLDDLPAVAYPRGVAFEPDGRLLTFAVRDPVTRRLDLEGRLVGTLPLEAESIRVDGEGRIVAVGPGPAGANERRVWVLAPGAEQPELAAVWTPAWDIGPDQPGARAPAAIDPSASWLVYGRDRRVFLRDLRAGRGEHDLLVGRHGTIVRAVSFHPGGHRLVSADEKGEIRLWALPERRMLYSIVGPPPSRFSLLSFDATGTRVAWSSASASASSVWEFDSPPPAPVLVYRQDVPDPGETVFHPAGTWLASTGLRHLTLHLLTGPRARVLSGHVEGPILDLAFSPDSKTLASCARDGLRIWPLTPEGGDPRRVVLPREYFAYGVAWLPSGRDLVVSAPAIGSYLVQVSGGPPRLILPHPAQTMSLGRVAVDQQGRSAAITSWYAAEARDLRLYLVDLRDGGVQSLPLRDRDDGDPWRGGVRSVGFGADGRIVFAGDGGLRRWDPRTGSVQTVAGGVGTYAVLAMDRAGRRAVVNIGSSLEGLTHLRDSRVLVVDLETGVQRTILSHGDRLTLGVATDPAGERVVTGDLAGVVRVGSVEGEAPHLLLGHSGPVRAVAVSPDGKWIASSSGAEIRLWPMPDLSKPPLHTLPYQDLMARLRTLTNLQVVVDEASATGYALEIGPFPGWKDLPSW